MGEELEGDVGSNHFIYLFFNTVFWQEYYSRDK